MYYAVLVCTLLANAVSPISQQNRQNDYNKKLQVRNIDLFDKDLEIHIAELDKTIRLFEGFLAKYKSSGLSVEAKKCEAIIASYKQEKIDIIDILKSKDKGLQYKSK